MAAPFADFIVPPILYLGLLLGGSAIICGLLYTLKPALTQRTVFAMIPWVVCGAILHVFYQLAESPGVHIYPVWAEPLVAAPAVYFTTFLGMGLVWLIAIAIETQSVAVTPDQVTTALAVSGLVVMSPLLVLFGWQMTNPLFHPLELVLPIGGLIVSLGSAAIVYWLLGTWRPSAIAEARYVGGLLIFAHIFDGVTTAIGVRFLNATERSYLPQLILEFARGLPTYDYIGAGWLFVTVKLLLAVGIVTLFTDYLRDHPRRGNLLFAIMAFVGLGPALNNFFLFLLNM